VDIADGTDPIAGDSRPPAGVPAFEFRNWMNVLDSHERDLMTLRFIEQWEYHEIAAARAILIGTVQWRCSTPRRSWRLTWRCA
jgi:DNA-directed RNA polymerase specialized sigma24 family protein